MTEARFHEDGQEAIDADPALSRDLTTRASVSPNSASVPHDRDSHLAQRRQFQDLVNAPKETRMSPGPLRLPCVLAASREQYSRSCSQPRAYISQVRKHLGAVHGVFYCRQCYARFDNDSDLAWHRESEICRSRCLKPDCPNYGYGEHHNGVTCNHKGNTPEDQWEAIYKILFPRPRSSKSGKVDDLREHGVDVSKQDVLDGPNLIVHAEDTSGSLRPSVTRQQILGRRARSADRSSTTYRPKKKRQHRTAGRLLKFNFPCLVHVGEFEVYSDHLMEFEHISTFLIHMKVHHFYGCPHCLEDFKTADLLKNHDCRRPCKQDGCSDPRHSGTTTSDVVCHPCKPDKAYRWHHFFHSKYPDHAKPNLYAFQTSVGHQPMQCDPRPEVAGIESASESSDRQHCVYRGNEREAESSRLEVQSIQLAQVEPENASQSSHSPAVQSTDALMANPFEDINTQLMEQNLQLAQELSLLKQQISSQSSQQCEHLRASLALLWQELRKKGGSETAPGTALYEIMRRDAPEALAADVTGLQAHPSHTSMPQISQGVPDPVQDLPDLDLNDYSNMTEHHFDDLIKTTFYDSGYGSLGEL